MALKTASSPDWIERCAPSPIWSFRRHNPSRVVVNAWRLLLYTFFLG